MKLKSAMCSTGHGTGVIQARTIGKARRFHLDPTGWFIKKGEKFYRIQERHRVQAEKADRAKREATERQRRYDAWHRRLGRAVARLVGRLIPSRQSRAHTHA